MMIKKKAESEFPKMPKWCARQDHHCPAQCHRGPLHAIPPPWSLAAPWNSWSSLLVPFILPCQPLPHPILFTAQPALLGSSQGQGLGLCKGELSLSFIIIPFESTSVWFTLIYVHRDPEWAFPPLYIFILKIKIYRGSGQVLSWLKCHPTTPGLRVRPPVRAHTRISQWMHEWWNSKLMFLSFSFF